MPVRRGTRRAALALGGAVVVLACGTGTSGLDGGAGPRCAPVQCGPDEHFCAANLCAPAGTSCPAIGPPCAARCGNTVCGAGQRCFGGCCVASGSDASACDVSCGQDAEGVGSCNIFFGWAVSWMQPCQPIIGCACRGADCKALYRSQAACPGSLCL